jgi:hypothetical protein
MVKFLNAIVNVNMADLTVWIMAGDAVLSKAATSALN